MRKLKLALFVDPSLLNSVIISFSSGNVRVVENRKNSGFQARLQLCKQFAIDSNEAIAEVLSRAYYFIMVIYHTRTLLL